MRSSIRRSWRSTKRFERPANETIRRRWPRRPRSGSGPCIGHRNSLPKPRQDHRDSTEPCCERAPRPPPPPLSPTTAELCARLRCSPTLPPKSPAIQGCARIRPRPGQSRRLAPEPCIVLRSCPPKPPPPPRGSRGCARTHPRSNKIRCWEGAHRTVRTFMFPRQPGTRRKGPPPVHAGRPGADVPGTGSPTALKIRPGRMLPQSSAASPRTPPAYHPHALGMALQPLRGPHAAACQSPAQTGPGHRHEAALGSPCRRNHPVHHPARVPGHVAGHRARRLGGGAARDARLDRPSGAARRHPGGVLALVRVGLRPHLHPPLPPRPPGARDQQLHRLRLPTGRPGQRLTLSRMRPARAPADPTREKFHWTAPAASRDNDQSVAVPPSGDPPCAAPSQPPP